MSAKTAIGKLTSIGALPVQAPPVDHASLSAALGDAAARVLWPLLSAKNGFLAFESALQVFGLDPQSSQGVAQWNSSAGWRSHYGSLTGGLTFFAQDLFGGQYAVERESIVKFDPELGERSDFAGSAEAWAQQVLEDYDYETGFTLGHEWQAEHRPLKFGERLYPKLPFVLGGDFELDNLWPAVPEKVLPLRGFLAQKLHGMEDGTHVKLVLPDGRKLQGEVQR